MGNQKINAVFTISMTQKTVFSVAYSEISDFEALNMLIVENCMTFDFSKQKSPVSMVRRLLGIWILHYG